MLTKTRFRLVMVQMLGMLWISGGMARAADWPNYRGPDHNGFSQETDWDAQEPKILWTKSIGFGFGSIAVADGRAYFMGNTGKEGDNANTDIVQCVDAESGKEIWRHEYPCSLEPKLHEGGPLATPIVDGKVVYTLSRMGDLFCFSAASGIQVVSLSWLERSCCRRASAGQHPPWPTARSTQGMLLAMRLASTSARSDTPRKAGMSNDHRLREGPRHVTRRYVPPKNHRAASRLGSVAALSTSGSSTLTVPSSPTSTRLRSGTSILTPLIQITTPS